MRLEPTEELLPHCLGELAYLRGAGAAFAQRYPQVAGRLALDATGSADPHVERLIESFAFLTARLQRLHEAQSPEIARSLLDVVQPSLIAPMPSMAVAAFVPDPRQARSLGGLTVPAGTTLFAHGDDGAVVRLRTGLPVALWPFGVAAADLLPAIALVATADAGDVAAVLRLRLTCLGNRHFAEFRPPMLRLFLHGPRGTAAGLHELLTHRLRSVLVADPETGTSLRVLPAASVRPVGLEPDEALLPQPAHAHDGYRLLQEYFAFPEKFLFVELHGLADGAGLGIGRTVDLLFLLEAAPDGDLVVDGGCFRLGCTPAVNLFPRVSEPIRLDLTRLEHRLEPDARNPRACEIRSIETVAATSAGRGGRRVRPYFSFTHDDLDRPGTAFWTARREPAVLPGARGTDVLLTFVDQALAPAHPPAEALFAHLLCTNRGLAEQIPAGARLDTEIDAPLAGVVCITRPTPQQPPVMGGAHLWHLVSQLSLNHLSLAGAEGLDALKEILRLHGGTRGDDAGGQVGLEARRVVRRVGTDAWRGLCRGLEITLQVDEDRFVGASPWLLGAVLSRFLALHAAANSFTQLVLTSRRRGRTAWPPQAGAAHIL
jgi:type VI secretion system protein ImpG